MSKPKYQYLPSSKELPCSDDISLDNEDATKPKTMFGLEYFPVRPFVATIVVAFGNGRSPHSH